MATRGFVEDLASSWDAMELRGRQRFAALYRFEGNLTLQVPELSDRVPRFVHTAQTAREII